METGKYLKLNLMGENDDADILKVTENFQKIEDMAPTWTNFSNSGTVLETEGDFQIATSFPVPEGQDGIFSVTVKMPRAFAEDDTVTVGGVAYNLYQGTDPALADAWKAGEVVTINFDKTSRRCWASAGGGAPRPIPAQVSNMNASIPEGETPQVLFTWTNPVDENFAGMVLIVKAGSAPNGVTDGTQVYKGTGTSFTYSEGVQWGVTYYGRGFAYNSQNKFQMDATGAIASARPSNTAPPVTEFKASIEKGSDTAVLTWKKPVSSFYAGVKIVRKPSSDPTSPSDGTEVYNGDGETYSNTGLLNAVEYHYAAFSYNKRNEYNVAGVQRATVTPNIIPENWKFLECITENKTWNPDEAGYYKVHVISKSGDGTDGKDAVTEYPGGKKKGGDGGDGGASGAIAISVLYLSPGDNIQATVSDTICSFGSYLSATGAVGKTQGVATGGTEYNHDGYPGVSGGRGGNVTFAQNGNKGENDGALGGTANTGDSWAGGGGSGGSRLPAPYYDYPYVPNNLSDYSGGNAAKRAPNTSVSTPGKSYPALSPESPKLYGGGNGGGGGTHEGDGPSSGSKGSPACIIIEKGVYK